MLKGSLLLELLNERQSWALPPYSRPLLDARYAKHVEEATHWHSKANDSDPFSAERIKMYMVAGYALPSEVKKDAMGLLDRRATEQREADTRLQQLAKRMQSDIAWNQHKASKWQEQKRKQNTNRSR